MLKPHPIRIVQTVVEPTKILLYGQIWRSVSVEILFFRHIIEWNSRSLKSAYYSKIHDYVVLEYTMTFSLSAVITYSFVTLLLSASLPVSSPIVFLQKMLFSWLWVLQLGWWSWEWCESGLTLYWAEPGQNLSYFEDFNRADGPYFAVSRVRSRSNRTLPEYTAWYRRLSAMISTM